jgi:hypothetical protein
MSQPRQRVGKLNEPDIRRLIVRVSEAPPIPYSWARS